MLEVNTGKYGAKRQSIQPANPRDVLYKLIVATPDKSEDELMEDCWHKVHKNMAMYRTIYEYWFANNLRSLVLHAAPDSPAAASKQRAAKANSAAAVRKLQDRIMINLLGMIMPTGKTLAASRREELLAMGGWTQRVAAQMQPGQTVADAGLTEKALRQLYEKNNV